MILMKSRSKECVAIIRTRINERKHAISVRQRCRRRRTELKQDKQHDVSRPYARIKIVCETNVSFRNCVHEDHHRHIVMWTRYSSRECEMYANYWRRWRQLQPPVFLSFISAAQNLFEWTANSLAQSLRFVFVCGARRVCVWESGFYRFGPNWPCSFFSSRHSRHTTHRHTK